MSHPATILLCGPSRSAVSGVATHLNQLFESSLAEKYSLHQFQLGSEGRDEGRLQKLLRYVTSPFAFLARIVRLRPDVVHLNTSLEPKSFWRDLVYLYTAKLFRRRVVLQVHGGEMPSRFLGSNPLSHAFLRFSLGLPDAIALLANCELEEYRNFRLATRIEIIPNAIRLGEYGGVQPKCFDAKPLVLGYIGRLADDKGIEETIEAIAVLRDRGTTDLELRIAGSGPYERALRELVRARSLEDTVLFVGAVFGQEKLEYWRDIDLFVFPTFHREGLPYTILEALASGTPTITTRVGGIPDVIRDGIEGVLLDTHECRVVSAAIQEAMSDRERLRTMSAAAIDRARQHYGVERLADQFDDLYAELLA